MNKLILAVLVASGSTITLAHAETAETREGPANFRAEMRALITGDGMEVADLANLMLERSEARFTAMDADADGIVTRDEFIAATGERAEAMFERMGPNEDGVVTREGRRGGWGNFHRGPREGRHAGRGMNEEQRAERLSERATAQFERLDADGDGMISPEEFEAGMQARGERFSERRGERAERRQEMREQRAERRTNRGEGGPGHEMRAEMREMHGQMRELMREGMDLAAFSGLMEERAGARFDRLDADSNGEITSEEFTAGIAARAETMFARMDRNDDGVVNRDDRPRWGGPRWGGRDGKPDAE